MMSTVETSTSAENNGEIPRHEELKDKVSPVDFHSEIPPCSHSLARAFLLDKDNEWVTVATGHTVLQLSEDGKALTASLHDENNPESVLFSATFHKDQDVSRQQGTLTTLMINK